MTISIEAASDGATARDLKRITEMLGGKRAFRNPVEDTLAAHDALVQGLPAAAVNHLIAQLISLRSASTIEKALGMSLRTIQRRREAPDEPLSLEQSARTWAFAAILAKATAVLGSQEEAEAWIERPAIGLDQRRPLDLLDTPVGRDAVNTYLDRIEYGVYA